MKYPSLQPFQLQPGQQPSGTYCPILFFDIAGFGNPNRDDDIQSSVREGFYQILDRAFRRVGAFPTAYLRDSGDGILAVFRPEIPVEQLAGLTVWLPPEIERHNKCASLAAQIQLRAALHVGPVYWDSYGVYGRALIHAARLIEAQPVRDALVTDQADLVFVISDFLYDTVIQHSPQAPPYRKIGARVKESSFTAWLTTSASRPPTAALPDQHQLAAVPDLLA